MGLGALELQHWLVVDHDLDHELAQKRDLLRDRPEAVLGLTATAGDGCREVLELLLDHLPRHHPALFGAVPGGLLVRRTGQVVQADDPAPLAVAGLLVQEDFCLMAPGQDGAYRLVAGFVAFPSRWRLAEKLGRPLDLIHEPVPGLVERLGATTARFFAALRPERPVERANWSLIDDPTLFQPEGRPRPPPCDLAQLGRHWWFRVERQTLRRLPRSGQVLFTIRSFVRPLKDLAASPETAAALAARLREMPSAMLAYKNLVAARPALLDWLDERAGHAALVAPQEPASRRQACPARAQP